MSKNTFVYGAVALLLGALLVPSTLGGTPLVNTSLGAAYVADFNDDNGGWTANPFPTPPRPAVSNPTWAWGTPTSGPGAAASGSKVWATNLAGNYNNNECDAILSPAIDLTGATQASVAFKSWRHFELSSSTGTAWDAGMLFVTTDGGATLTVVTPNGGYSTGNTLSTSARTCFDGAPTTARGLAGPVTAPTSYSTINTNLDAFVGQVVQFVIAFGTDGSGNRAGWYVDDFTVTKDGVSAVENFESGNGGFTIVSTKAPPAHPKGWSWGVPTSGPGGVSAMWATNPAGNHGPSECSWTESTPFQVGDLAEEAAAAGRATLSWLQWFKTSTAAGGVVQVGVDGAYANLVPTSGYPGSATSSLDACLGHVTSGSGAFSGTLNPTTEMTEYTADLTPWLGQTVTLRFLFASTTSTATNEGWYVDDVLVETAAYAEAPDAPVPDLGEVIPTLGTFDETAWTVGGATSWAYGEATSGPSGETAWGTNLNGNYQNSECGWIETPAVDASLLAFEGLQFDHWYRTEGKFDGGFVLASTDGGATWSYVDTGGYDNTPYTSLSNCMASFGVTDAATRGVYTGSSGGWETVNVDMSLYSSPGGTVKLRFVFGSDVSVTYPGWYVKNVSLGGYDLV